MSTWNPYAAALKRLERLSEDELERYVFLRLTGREAEPPCDWSRNQEAPEDFLIWAYGNGEKNKEFAQRLSNCLGSLAREHFDFLERPGEDQFLSRLLYLAGTIKAFGVAPALQEVLIEQGKIRIQMAKSLLDASSIPWGETLLHQSLGTLSILETAMETRDQRARVPFWKPIVQGELALPKSTRIIALRALARINWKTAIEHYLRFFVDVLMEDRQKGRRRHSVVRELTNVINFFLQESKRQEEAGIVGVQLTLFEDPTPLAVGFYRFANKKDVRSFLKDALEMLCSSRHVFGGDNALQRIWKEEFVSKIDKEIAAERVGSVLVRVEAKRAVEQAIDYCARLGALRKAERKRPGRSLFFSPALAA